MCLTLYNTQRSTITPAHAYSVVKVGVPREGGTLVQPGRRKRRHIDCFDLYSLQEETRHQEHFFRSPGRPLRTSGIDSTPFRVSLTEFALYVGGKYILICPLTFQLQSVNEYSILEIVLRVECESTAAVPL